MTEILKNRYDFALIFDVIDGNPNGDPDAGNLPRVDPETGHGLVTDVCLKRKVRNFVGLAKKEEPPYEIYVKEKAILNQQHERAYKALGVDISQSDAKRKGGDKTDDARKWMCQNFFDVRAFGAVMSTGVNCGQVRGPIQITFARSIDPIIPLEHTITRMAVATEEEAKKQSGDNRTMGRKFTVPYGVYVAHGFVSANLAAQTCFSEGDLELFWEALIHMFEHDRSAARGQMQTRGLFVFKHESALGNAPAHKLFERIRIRRKDGVVAPRSFEDYVVDIEERTLPAGIELLRKVDIQEPAYAAR